MKKILILCLLSVAVFITGCDNEHNFMDVDNPNAKDDLMAVIGSGNMSGINIDEIIPDSLSGTIDSAKGYADKYYSGFLSEYVDKVRESLSGARQTIKGYYNNFVDELNEMISNKVSEVISGEMNKFKIK